MSPLFRLTATPLFLCALAFSSCSIKQEIPAGMPDLTQLGKAVTSPAPKAAGAAPSAPVATGKTASGSPSTPAPKSWNPAQYEAQTPLPGEILGTWAATKTEREAVDPHELVLHVSKYSKSSFLVTYRARCSTTARATGRSSSIKEAFDGHLLASDTQSRPHRMTIQIDKVGSEGESTCPHQLQLARGDEGAKVNCIYEIFTGQDVRTHFKLSCMRPFRREADADFPRDFSLGAANWDDVLTPLPPPPALITAPAPPQPAAPAAAPAPAPAAAPAPAPIPAPSDQPPVVSPEQPEESSLPIPPVPPVLPAPPQPAAPGHHLSCSGQEFYFNTDAYGGVGSAIISPSGVKYDAVFVSVSSYPIYQTHYALNASQGPDSRSFFFIAKKDLAKARGNQEIVIHAFRGKGALVSLDVAHDTLNCVYVGGEVDDPQPVKAKPPAKPRPKPPAPQKPKSNPAPRQPQD